MPWKKRNGTEGRKTEVHYIYNGKDVFVGLLTDKGSPLIATYVQLLYCVFTTWEGQNWHNAITELEAIVLHHVAGHGNCVF